MAAFGQSVKRWLGFHGATDIKSSATHYLPHPSQQVTWVTPNKPQWTNRSYAALVHEGYLKNSVAHRCVRMIAECASGLPLKIKRDGIAIDNSSVGKVLRRPNPLQDMVTFFETLYANILLSGNAYIEVVKGADGSPVELYLLRPDRMTVVPGSNGWPKAYDYKVSGRVHRFPVDPITAMSNILHIKNFHPLDDHYGMSALQAAAQSVDIHNATADWNKALLDNAARPSGALVFEPGEGQSAVLSDDQMKRLKQEMREQFQGQENAGRPFLLEGGLKWQSVGFSPIEVNRRTAVYMRLQYIILAKLLAVLGLLFWDRFINL